ncbi:MAG: hypothetical protein WC321_07145, partial [Candidatus Omnitrophota bacterium]
MANLDTKESPAKSQESQLPQETALPINNTTNAAQPVQKELQGGRLFNAPIIGPVIRFFMPSAVFAAEQSQKAQTGTGVSHLTRGPTIRNATAPSAGAQSRMDISAQNSSSSTSITDVSALEDVGNTTGASANSQGGTGNAEGVTSANAGFGNGTGGSQGVSSGRIKLVIIETFEWLKRLYQELIRSLKPTRPHTGLAPPSFIDNLTQKIRTLTRPQILTTVAVLGLAALLLIRAVDSPKTSGDLTPVAALITTTGGVLWLKSITQNSRWTIWLFLSTITLSLLALAKTEMAIPAYSCYLSGVMAASILVTAALTAGSSSLRATPITSATGLMQPAYQPTGSTVPTTKAVAVDLVAASKVGPVKPGEKSQFNPEGNTEEPYKTPGKKPAGQEPQEFPQMERGGRQGRNGRGIGRGHHWLRIPHKIGFHEIDFSLLPEFIKRWLEARFSDNPNWLGFTMAYSGNHFMHWLAEKQGRIKGIFTGTGLSRSPASDKEVDAYQLMLRRRYGEEFDEQLWPEEAATINELYRSFLKHGKVFAEISCSAGKSTVILPALAYLIRRHQGYRVFSTVSHDHFSYRDARAAAKLFGNKEVVGYITQDKKSFIFRNPAADPEELSSREQLYNEATIIFAVLSEFNFDYQNELLTYSYRNLAQAKRNWVILSDEADEFMETLFSPHSISAEGDEKLEGLIRQAFAVAEEIKDNRKMRRIENRTIVLEPAGLAYVRERITIEKKKEWFSYFLVEQALGAFLCFEKERHYHIQDGQAVIFGESQELLQGRRWQDYLHLFIELKEGLPLKTEGKIHSQMYLVNYINSPHIKGLIALTGSLGDEAALVKEVFPDAQVLKFKDKVRGRLIDNKPIKMVMAGSEKLAQTVERVSEISRTGIPVMVKVGPLEESEGLGELLMAQGIKAEFINALNSDNPEEIEKIVARASEPGKVTIVTAVGARGINILFNEAQEKTLYLLDADLSWSSLRTKQFKRRGARKPGETAYWEAIYSLEDSIFHDFPGLTEEAKDTLKVYGAAGAERIIRVLQGKILEEKILNARSQKRVWEYTGSLWQQLINIRLNILRHGIVALYGDKAQEVREKLSPMQRAVFGKAALRRLDSQVGNFFAYANEFKQQLDYEWRHSSEWKRLWQVSYPAQLLTRARKARQDTVADIWSVVAPIVQEVTAETGVELPAAKKQSNWGIIVPVIILAAVAAAFILFYKAGILALPIAILTKTGIALPALSPLLMALLGVAALLLQKAVLIPALSRDTSADDFSCLMNRTARRGYLKTVKFVLNKPLVIIGFLGAIAGLMAVFVSLVSPAGSSVDILIAALGLRVACYAVLASVISTIAALALNYKDFLRKVILHDYQQGYKFRRVFEYLGVGLVANMLTYILLSSLLPGSVVAGLGTLGLLSAALLSGYILSETYRYISSFRDTPHKTWARLGTLASAATFVSLYYLLHGGFVAAGGSVLSVSVLGSFAFTITGILMIGAAFYLSQRFASKGAGRTAIWLETLPINIPGLVISGFGIYGLVKLMGTGAVASLPLGGIVVIAVFGLLMAGLVAKGKVRVAATITGMVITSTVAMGCANKGAYLRTSLPSIERAAPNPALDSRGIAALDSLSTQTPELSDANNLPAMAEPEAQEPNQPIDTNTIPQSPAAAPEFITAAPADAPEAALDLETPALTGTVTAEQEREVVDNRPLDVNNNGPPAAETYSHLNAITRLYQDIASTREEIAFHKDLLIVYQNHQRSATKIEQKIKELEKTLTALKAELQRAIEVGEQVAKLQEERAFQQDVLEVHKKHQRPAAEIKAIEQTVNQLDREISALRPNVEIAPTSKQPVTAKTPAPATQERITKPSAPVKSQPTKQAPAERVKKPEEIRQPAAVVAPTPATAAPADINQVAAVPHIQQPSGITAGVQTVPMPARPVIDLSVGDSQTFYKLQKEIDEWNFLNEIGTWLGGETKDEKRRKIAELLQQVLEEDIIPQIQQSILESSDVDVEAIKGHYERGRNYLRQGRYVEAVNEFERIVDLDPRYKQDIKQKEEAAKKFWQTLRQAALIAAGFYPPAWPAVAAINAYDEIKDNEIRAKLRAQVEEALSRGQAVVLFGIPGDKIKVGLPTFWRDEGYLDTTIPLYIDGFEAGIPITIEGRSDKVFAYGAFNPSFGKGILISPMGSASGKQFSLPQQNSAKKDDLGELIGRILRIAIPVGKQILWSQVVNGDAGEEMIFFISGVDISTGILEQLDIDKDIKAIPVNPVGSYVAKGKVQEIERLLSMPDSKENKQKIIEDLYFSAFYFLDYYSNLDDNAALFRGIWGRNPYLQEPMRDEVEVEALNLSRRDLIRWLFNHEVYRNQIRSQDKYGWDNIFRQYVLKGTLIKNKERETVPISGRDAQGDNLYIYHELRKNNGEYVGRATIHFNGTGELIGIESSARDGSRVTVRNSNGNLDVTFVSKDKKTKGYLATTWQSSEQNPQFKLIKTEIFDQDFRILRRDNADGSHSVFTREKLKNAWKVTEVYTDKEGKRIEKVGYETDKGFYSQEINPETGEIHYYFTPKGQKEATQEIKIEFDAVSGAMIRVAIAKQFATHNNEYYTQHGPASEEVLAGQVNVGDVYVAPAKGKDATRQVSGVTVANGQVSGTERVAKYFASHNGEYYTEHGPASTEAQEGTVYVSPAKGQDATREVTGVSVRNGQVTGTEQLAKQFATHNNEYYTQHGPASEEVLAGQVNVGDVYVAPAKGKDATRQVSGVTVANGQVSGTERAIKEFRRVSGEVKVNNQIITNVPEGTTLCTDLQKGKGEQESLNFPESEVIKVKAVIEQEYNSSLDIKTREDRGRLNAAYLQLLIFANTFDISIEEATEVLRNSQIVPANSVDAPVVVPPAEKINSAPVSFLSRFSLIPAAYGAENRADNNALPPAAINGQIEARADGLYVNGQKLFIIGVNWRGIEYGYNFGAPQAGFASQKQLLEIQLAAMENAGVQKVRMNLLDDARNLSRGYNAFKADIQAFLDACAKHNIKVEFVLFDYLAVARGNFNMSEREVNSFIKNFLTPLLKDSGNHPALIAIDFINEPEWILDQSVAGGWGDKMEAGRKPIAAD